MNVLVVAFDGLDKELIEEFDLENIKMNDFGSVDNNTSISKRMTSELFTAFITGKNYSQHGIKGLEPEESGRDLISKVPKRLRVKLKSYDNVMSAAGALLGWQSQDVYSREDIKCDTLFDEIESSEDLNIPVYSQNTFMERMFIGFDLGYGADVVERDLIAEHNQRKRELMSEIAEDHNFLMAHFFYPDTFQHLYEGLEDEKDHLREMYERMDNLAGKIKRNAGYNGFDVIIFMSDHGKPSKDAHNRNAFYSSNQKLFENEANPHITDFHDVILEFVQ